MNNSIQKIKDLFKYARRLYIIELIKDEKEKEFLLEFEPKFKVLVNEYFTLSDKNPLSAFLLFVANKELYTMEEKSTIGGELLKETLAFLKKQNSNT